MKYRSFLAFIWVANSLGCLSLPPAAEAPRPPETPKRPVTETYHGVPVTEDYRWLEDANDPQVKRWLRRQNRYTASHLRRLPHWKAVYDRLLYLEEERPVDWDQLIVQAGKLFALQDGVLVTIDFAKVPPATIRDLLDPDKALPEKNANIMAYYPSPDARLVAVVLSVEGREDGSVFVYDADTAKRLSDELPRVFSASGGSLAWKPDNSGFYYTRHPRDANTPHKDQNAFTHVYLHTLGKPMADDIYVFGKGFRRLEGITLATSRDARYLLALVNRGTEAATAIYLYDGTPTWRRIADYADEIAGLSISRDNDLYLISEKGAPRGKLLRLSLREPTLERARVVLPEGDKVLQMALPTNQGLYVVDNLAGGDRLRIFDRDGNVTAALPLQPMASVSQMLDLKDGTVLYRVESYRDPPTWYRFEPATGRSVKIDDLASPMPADFSSVEIVREWATSKDGTRVPLTILQRKGTSRDGNNPTLLTGYGGYGDSQLPDFQVERIVWLEQGGIFAIAHVRGGGELGADWRRDGQLTKKQNAIDDFAACMKLLVDRRYTSPAKFAISGASQGGALVGAVLTQHPAAIRAMVGEVGAYDLLRSELHPNEAYSITEQGTVTVPDQFRALYAYSPYHRVVDSTAYPAVFLLTGENDERVGPANSWKMAARLQAATSSGLPVFLWTGQHSGHDNGARADIVTRQADIFAFLFDQLGVKYKPVPNPGKKKAPASVIGALLHSTR